MKNMKNLWIILVLAAFCFIGCTSMEKPVPVRYSFAGNDNNMTASINFISGKKVGVRLFDCEGVSMPAPSKGTYWESDVLFPAETPLNIRVYIYWKEDQYGERRRGIFKCPPLEPGREYKVWFNGDYKGGSIILTHSNVTELRYSSGKPQFEIVYEQIIPAPPK
jgi:hypothetical protein